MRKEQLENIVLMGKIEGKRAKGRWRMKYLDSMKRWSNIGAEKTIQRAYNRKMWHDMIANIQTEHGTEKKIKDPRPK